MSLEIHGGYILNNELKFRRKSTLAINGSMPVRKKPMPPRIAFGKNEVAHLMKAVNYYISRKEDPPYQGHFEKEFCNAFSEFMGGGYTDAVSSGTAAIYVALAALELPKKSHVIISPVTDSATLNCIIYQGFIPVLADSKPDSYNMGVEQFLDRITTNTKGVIAVHCAGEPLEIDEIADEAHKRDILVLEDCSQATGATCKGKKVGTFGDISAFSTMYRKNLTAGASSGLVYTQDLNLFRKALGHADRGKQSWRTDLDQNDPGQSLFPALNFNTDEFSCAIGTSSLKRLPDTISKRVKFISRLIELLNSKSKLCKPYAFHNRFSPFFYPIFMDINKIACSKIEFANAVKAEGIGLNPHYGCVVNSWKWAKPYFSDDFVTTNALSTRDRSFNLFLNENYGEEEAQDIISAILKVEKYYMKIL